MRLVKPRLRRERLERLQAVLQEADCAAALFFDPINIRYATDVSNMQVWCLHNPARYAFVAADGPVVLFEFRTCEHLAASMELVDEVAAALQVDAEVRQTEVRDEEDAVRLRFLGSPSIRIDGIDIEPGARKAEEFALGCRLYGRSGVPPKELLVAAMERCGEERTDSPK